MGPSGAPRDGTPHPAAGRCLGSVYGAPRQRAPPLRTACRRPPRAPLLGGAERAPRPLTAVGSLVARPPRARERAPRPPTAPRALAQRTCADVTVGSEGRGGAAPPPPPGRDVTSALLGNRGLKEARRSAAGGCLAAVSTPRAVRREGEGGRGGGGGRKGVVAIGRGRGGRRGRLGGGGGRRWKHGVTREAYVK